MNTTGSSPSDAASRPGSHPDKTVEDTITSLERQIAELRQLNDGSAPTARLTYADTGAQADTFPEPGASELDIEALSSVARSVTPAPPRPVRLSRRERKAEKRRLRDEAARIKKEAKEARRRASGDAQSNRSTLSKRRVRSIQRRLKERDRELSKKSRRKRDARRRAKDITGGLAILQ